MNVDELSKYTPRYLADVTQLTGRPYTITLEHAFLYLGPKRKQADFFALTAIHAKFNSNSQRLQIHCRAWIDGAINIMSSAYRNIAVQSTPILLQLSLDRRNPGYILSTIPLIIFSTNGPKLNNSYIFYKLADINVSNSGLLNRTNLIVI